MSDINKFVAKVQKQLHIAEAAHNRAGKELEAFHRLAEEAFRLYRKECESVGLDITPFSGGGDKPPRNPNG